MGNKLIELGFKVDRGEEWDLSENYGCAWLRGSNDYDWEIIEVE